MLSFTGSLKVLLAAAPCDLSKSFNGLHGLITARLGDDPRKGALFVFTNRRRTRLKMSEQLDPGRLSRRCAMRWLRGLSRLCRVLEAFNSILHPNPSGLADAEEKIRHVGHRCDKLVG